MAGFLETLFGGGSTLLGGKTPALPIAPDAAGTDTPATLAQDILYVLASDQGEAAAAELLKIVGLFDPALIPLLTLAAPAIQTLAKNRLAALDAGIADGSLIVGPKGDIYSKAWAADPRHVLNADGTFKF